jgi:drug/metabolite transporter (DMT)-like permease
MLKIHPQNQFIEIGLLVLLSLLWGSSFTLIKIAIGTVPPATIVLGRLVLGAALLLLLVRINNIALPKSAKTWGGFVIQGLLQSAIPFTLVSWGEKYISSGLAGLLNSTPPLFSFLIIFLFSDRPIRLCENSSVW